MSNNSTKPPSLLVAEESFTHAKDILRELDTHGTSAFQSAISNILNISFTDYDEICRLIIELFRISEHHSAISIFKKIIVSKKISVTQLLVAFYGQIRKCSNTKEIHLGLQEVRKILEKRDFQADLQQNETILNLYFLFSEILDSPQLTQQHIRQSLETKKSEAYDIQIYHLMNQGDYHAAFDIAKNAKNHTSSINLQVQLIRCANLTNQSDIGLREYMILVAKYPQFLQNNSIEKHSLLFPGSGSIFQDKNALYNAGENGIQYMNHSSKIRYLEEIRSITNITLLDDEEIQYTLSLLQFGFLILKDDWCRDMYVTFLSRCIGSSVVSLEWIIESVSQNHNTPTPTQEKHSSLFDAPQQEQHQYFLKESELPMQIFINHLNTIQEHCIVFDDLETILHVQTIVEHLSQSKKDCRNFAKVLEKKIQKFQYAAENFEQLPSLLQERYHTYLLEVKGSVKNTEILHQALKSDENGKIFDEVSLLFVYTCNQILQNPGILLAPEFIERIVIEYDPLFAEELVLLAIEGGCLDGDLISTVYSTISLQHIQSLAHYCKNISADITSTSDELSIQQSQKENSTRISYTLQGMHYDVIDLEIAQSYVIVYEFLLFQTGRIIYAKKLNELQKKFPEVAMLGKYHMALMSKNNDAISQNEHLLKSQLLSNKICQVQLLVAAEQQDWKKFKEMQLLAYSLYPAGANAMVTKSILQYLEQKQEGFQSTEKDDSEVVLPIITSLLTESYNTTLLSDDEINTLMLYAGEWLISHADMNQSQVNLRAFIIHCFLSKYADGNGNASNILQQIKCIEGILSTRDNEIIEALRSLIDTLPISDLLLREEFMVHNSDNSLETEALAQNIYNLLLDQIVVFYQGNKHDPDVTKFLFIQTHKLLKEYFPGFLAGENLQYLQIGHSYPNENIVLH